MPRVRQRLLQNGREKMRAELTTCSSKARKEHTMGEFLVSRRQAYRKII
jgi:hypothetical protein